MGDEENGMAENTEVLMSLSRMEGQLNTLLGVLDRHDADIRKVDSTQQSDKAELIGHVHLLDNRVTAIEASKRGATPWYTIVSALASIGAVITVVLVLLDGRYS